MRVADALRVAALKSEARRLCLRVRRRSGVLSCGAHIAGMLPSIAVDEARFREVMAELATLDPEAKRLVDRGEVL